MHELEYAESNMTGTAQANPHLRRKSVGTLELPLLQRTLKSAKPCPTGVVGLHYERQGGKA